MIKLDCNQDMLANMNQKCRESVSGCALNAVLTRILRFWAAHSEPVEDGKLVQVMCSVIALRKAITSARPCT